MLTVGYADANWLGGNFSHLQLQGQNSIINNKFSMVARGATNYFNAYEANGTGGSPTNSTDGRTILGINAHGYQNGGNHLAASIHFKVDGTPTGNFVPGEIAFSTGTNAAGNTSRMTIKSDGKVGIGISAPTSTLDVAGSVSKPITIQTSNYTAAENDYTIICTPPSGVLTVSLPTATTYKGRIYIIRNTRVGSGDPIITIVPAVGEFFDGIAALTTLSVGYHQILTAGVSHSVTIQSDGTGWWVISATMYN